MKSRIRNSFSARLSFYILSITAILFIIALLIVAIWSRRLIKEEASRNATNTLRATISDIEKIIIDVESAAKNNVWIAQLQDDPEYVYTITQRFVAENENVVGSTIAFEPYHFQKKKEWYAPYSYKEEKTGEILTIQMGNENYDYHVMEWYLVPKLLKKPYWSNPYFDAGGGEQMMSTYSIPLMDENGEVYAVFTADISLKKTTEKISRTKPYKNSYTILLSQNGSFICHQSEEKLLDETIFSVAYKMNEPKIAEVGKRMVAGESGVSEFKNEFGNAFIVYGGLSNGWSAAIICPYEDVQARALEMNIILILVLSLGLLLLFILCMSTIRQLTKPLTEFSQSAHEIAHGNFNAPLPKIVSKDEMKELHDSFEYMQKSLVNYIAELKESTANKERILSELSIARNIQMNMVPTNFDDIKDVKIYGTMVPAKEVGGDLYDFFVKDDKLYFCIGDVSGKGVPAAFYMAMSRAAFHYIGRMDLQMDELVSHVNDSLADGNTYNMFITLFAGCLNLKTGEFTYCNAGHNPIMIAPPNEEAYYLDVKANLALGLFTQFPYLMQKTTLKEGTKIILYTDGVTEAENAKKDQYGEERLKNWANNLAKDATPQTAVDELLSSVRQFTNGEPQNDDITIFIIDNTRKKE